MLMERILFLLLSLLAFFAATVRPYFYYLYDPDVYVFISSALYLVIFQIHLPFHHAVVLC